MDIGNDRWRREIRERLYPAPAETHKERVIRLDRLVAQNKSNPKNFSEILKKDLWQCPKTDKCVMDCHHRIPHEHDKFCNQRDPVNKGSECPSCVKELAADITFFPEDFNIE